MEKIAIENLKKKKKQKKKRIANLTNKLSIIPKEILLPYI